MMETAVFSTAAIAATAPSRVAPTLNPARSLQPTRSAVGETSASGRSVTGLGAAHGKAQHLGAAALPKARAVWPTPPFEATLPDEDASSTSSVASLSLPLSASVDGESSSRSFSPTPPTHNTDIAQPRGGHGALSRDAGAASASTDARSAAVGESMACLTPAKSAPSPAAHKMINDRCRNRSPASLLDDLSTSHCSGSLPYSSPVTSDRRDVVCSTSCCMVAARASATATVPVAQRAQAETTSLAAGSFLTATSFATPSSAPALCEPRSSAPPAPNAAAAAAVTAALLAAARAAAASEAAAELSKSTRRSSQAKNSSNCSRTSPRTSVRTNLFRPKTGAPPSLSPAPVGNPIGDDSRAGKQRCSPLPSRHASAPHNFSGSTHAPTSKTQSAPGSVTSFADKLPTNNLTKASHPAAAAPIGSLEADGLFALRLRPAGSASQQAPRSCSAPRITGSADPPQQWKSKQESQLQYLQQPRCHQLGPQQHLETRQALVPFPLDSRQPCRPLQTHTIALRCSRACMQQQAAVTEPRRDDRTNGRAFGDAPTAAPALPQLGDSSGALRTRTAVVAQPASEPPNRHRHVHHVEVCSVPHCMTVPLTTVKDADSCAARTIAFKSAVKPQKRQGAATAGAAQCTDDMASGDYGRKLQDGEPVPKTIIRPAFPGSFDLRPRSPKDSEPRAATSGRGAGALPRDQLRGRSRRISFARGKPIGILHETSISTANDYACSGSSANGAGRLRSDHKRSHISGEGASCVTVYHGLTGCDSLIRNRSVLVKQLRGKISGTWYRARRIRSSGTSESMYTSGGSSTGLDRSRQRTIHKASTAHGCIEGRRRSKATDCRAIRDKNRSCKRYIRRRRIRRRCGRAYKCMMIDDIRRGSSGGSSHVYTSDGTQLTCHSGVTSDCTSCCSSSGSPSWINGRFRRRSVRRMLPQDEKLATEGGHDKHASHASDHKLARSEDSLPLSSHYLDTCSHGSARGDMASVEKVCLHPNQTGLQRGAFSRAADDKTAIVTSTTTYREEGYRTCATARRRATRKEARADVGAEVIRRACLPTKEGARGAPETARITACATADQSSDAGSVVETRMWPLENGNSTEGLQCSPDAHMEEMLQEKQQSTPSGEADEKRSTYDGAACSRYQAVPDRACRESRNRLEMGALGEAASRWGETTKANHRGRKWRELRKSKSGLCTRSKLEKLPHFGATTDSSPYPGTACSNCSKSSSTRCFPSAGEEPPSHEEWKGRSISSRISKHERERRCCRPKGNRGNFLSEARTRGMKPESQKKYEDAGGTNNRGLSAEIPYTFRENVDEIKASEGQQSEGLNTTTQRQTTRAPNAPGPVHPLEGPEAVQVHHYQQERQTRAHGATRRSFSWSARRVNLEHQSGPCSSPVDVKGSSSTPPAERAPAVGFRSGNCQQESDSSEHGCHVNQLLEPAASSTLTCCEEASTVISNSIALPDCEPGACDVSRHTPAVAGPAATLCSEETLPSAETSMFSECPLVTTPSEAASGVTAKGFPPISPGSGSLPGSAAAGSPQLKRSAAASPTVAAAPLAEPLVTQSNAVAQPSVFTWWSSLVEHAEDLMEVSATSSATKHTADKIPPPNDKQTTNVRQQWDQVSGLKHGRTRAVSCLPPRRKNSHGVTGGFSHVRAASSSADGSTSTSRSPPPSASSTVSSPSLSGDSCFSSGSSFASSRLKKSYTVHCLHPFSSSGASTACAARPATQSLNASDSDSRTGARRCGRKQKQRHRRDSSSCPGNIQRRQLHSPTSFPASASPSQEKSDGQALEETACTDEYCSSRNPTRSDSLLGSRHREISTESFSNLQKNRTNVAKTRQSSVACEPCGTNDTRLSPSASPHVVVSLSAESSPSSLTPSSTQPSSNSATTERATDIVASVSPAASAVVTAFRQDERTPTSINTSAGDHEPVAARAPTDTNAVSRQAIDLPYLSNCAYVASHSSEARCQSAATRPALATNFTQNFHTVLDVNSSTRSSCVPKTSVSSPQQRVSTPSLSAANVSAPPADVRPAFRGSHPPPGPADVVPCESTVTPSCDPAAASALDSVVESNFCQQTTVATNVVSAQTHNLPSLYTSRNYDRRQELRCRSSSGRSSHSVERSPASRRMKNPLSLVSTMCGVNSGGESRSSDSGSSCSGLTCTSSNEAFTCVCDSSSAVSKKQASATAGTVAEVSRATHIDPLQSQRVCKQQPQQRPSRRLHRHRILGIYRKQRPQHRAELSEKPPKRQQRCRSQQQFQQEQQADSSSESQWDGGYATEGGSSSVFLDDKTSTCSLIDSAGGVRSREDSTSSSELNSNAWCRTGCLSLRCCHTTPAPSEFHCLSHVWVRSSTNRKGTDRSGSTALVQDRHRSVKSPRFPRRRSVQTTASVEGSCCGAPVGKKSTPHTNMQTAFDEASPLEILKPTNTLQEEQQNTQQLLPSGASGPSAQSLLALGVLQDSNESSKNAAVSQRTLSRDTKHRARGEQHLHRTEEENMQLQYGCDIFQPAGQQLQTQLADEQQMAVKKQERGKSQLQQRKEEDSLLQQQQRQQQQNAAAAQDEEALQRQARDLKVQLVRRLSLLPQEAAEKQHPNSWGVLNRTHPIRKEVHGGEQIDEQIDVQTDTPERTGGHGMHARYRKMSYGSVDYQHLREQQQLLEKKQQHLSKQKHQLCKLHQECLRRRRGLRAQRCSDISVLPLQHEEVVLLERCPQLEGPKYGRPKKQQQQQGSRQQHEDLHAFLIREQRQLQLRKGRLRQQLEKHCRMRKAFDEWRKTCRRRLQRDRKALVQERHRMNTKEEQLRKLTHQLQLEKQALQKERERSEVQQQEERTKREMAEKEMLEREQRLVTLLKELKEKTKESLRQLQQHDEQKLQLQRQQEQYNEKIAELKLEKRLLKKQQAAVQNQWEKIQKALDLTSPSKQWETFQNASELTSPSKRLSLLEQPKAPQIPRQVLLGPTPAPPLTDPQQQLLLLQRQHHQHTYPNPIASHKSQSRPQPPVVSTAEHQEDDKTTSGTAQDQANLRGLDCMQQQMSRNTTGQSCQCNAKTQLQHDDVPHAEELSDLQAKSFTCGNNKPTKTMEPAVLRATQRDRIYKRDTAEVCQRTNAETAEVSPVALPRCARAAEAAMNDSGGATTTAAGSSLLESNASATLSTADALTSITEGASEDLRSHGVKGIVAPPDDQEEKEEEEDEQTERKDPLGGLLSASAAGRSLLRSSSAQMPEKAEAYASRTSNRSSPCSSRSGTSSCSNNSVNCNGNSSSNDCLHRQQQQQQSCTLWRDAITQEKMFCEVQTTTSTAHNEDTSRCNQRMVRELQQQPPEENDELSNADNEESSSPDKKAKKPEKDGNSLLLSIRGDCGECKCVEEKTQEEEQDQQLQRELRELLLRQQQQQQRIADADAELHRLTQQHQNLLAMLENLQVEKCELLQALEKATLLRKQHGKELAAATKRAETAEGAVAAMQAAAAEAEVRAAAAEKKWKGSAAALDAAAAAAAEKESQRVAEYHREIDTLNKYTAQLKAAVQRAEKEAAQAATAAAKDREAALEALQQQKKREAELETSLREAHDALEKAQQQQHAYEMRLRSIQDCLTTATKPLTALSSSLAKNDTAVSKKMRHYSDSQQKQFPARPSISPVAEAVSPKFPSNLLQKQISGESVTVSTEAAPSYDQEGSTAVTHITQDSEEACCLQPASVQSDRCAAAAALLQPFAEAAAAISSRSKRFQHKKHKALIDQLPRKTAADELPSPAGLLSALTAAAAAATRTACARVNLKQDSESKIPTSTGTGVFPRPSARRLLGSSKEKGLAIDCGMVATNERRGRYVAVKGAAATSSTSGSPPDLGRLLLLNQKQGEKLALIYQKQQQDPQNERMHSLKSPWTSKREDTSGQHVEVEQFHHTVRESGFPQQQAIHISRDESRADVNPTNSILFRQSPDTEKRAQFSRSVTRESRQHTLMDHITEHNPAVTPVVSENLYGSNPSSSCQLNRSPVIITPLPATENTHAAEKTSCTAFTASVTLPLEHALAAAAAEDESVCSPAARVPLRLERRFSATEKQHVAQSRELPDETVLVP